MTYGAETRAATTKTKQLLKTTEMYTLRAILGKTRFDRMKNVDTLERCNLQEVVKFVKSRRKARNEHVSRAEQRLIKLVRDARPNTKRPPGRPPKRWADSWQSSFTGTPKLYGREEEQANIAFLKKKKKKKKKIYTDCVT